MFGRATPWLRRGTAFAASGAAALAGSSKSSVADCQASIDVEMDASTAQNLLKALKGPKLAEKSRREDMAHALVEVGQYRTVRSTILSEERLVVVSTPREYETNPTRKYDCIFVLDPDDHMLTTLSIAGHLSECGVIPPLVVVGVYNTDRNHELLPEPKRTPVLTSDGEPFDCNAGGAHGFLRFLKRELVPYIENNYRVTDHRVLYGHSFGGVFALYALCNEQENPFCSLIANDPSMWWDRGEQLNELKPALERLVTNVGSSSSRVSGDEAFSRDADGGRPTAFFQSSAGCGGPMLANQWRMAAVFEEALTVGARRKFADYAGVHPREYLAAGAGSRMGEWVREGHPQLRWKFLPMYTENHGTANVRCLHEGLQWLYKDYRGSVEWDDEAEAFVPLRPGPAAVVTTGGVAAG
jgi:predicted alpha/beta superfamily hydrolase